MEIAVMLGGLVAEAVGWGAVAAGRRDVWRLMPIVLGLMGVAAVVVHPPTWSTVGAGPALLVGLLSGALLYGGTLAFVWVASFWEPFRRAVAGEYQQAAEITLRRSLSLSLLIMVPSEELFWRGLFQGRLDQGMAAGAAVALAVLAYLAANVPSRSLPIIAGAVVGGAVWCGLFWWSGGVLACLGSHILWTGAMLAFPPGAGRKVRSA
jgi:membrane protease YdiL (CAAX protease family)